jgi:hypothetical protein
MGLKLGIPYYVKNEAWSKEGGSDGKLKENAKLETY